jgi:hypothetical protein
MVVHPCNHIIWEVEAEIKDHAFETILGYIARPCLIKTNNQKRVRGEPKTMCVF